MSRKSHSRVMAGYAGNVHKGIKLDLSSLSELDKRSLVKFIGRVSEVSYRRGFQQAHQMTVSGHVVADPFELRYRRHIDSAPCGETAEDSGRSAVDVLRIEYGPAFEAIGLPLGLVNCP